MHFSGTLDALKAHVAALECPGHWSDEGAFVVYRLEAGETINFWPANGELQVQGHPERILALRSQLADRLGAEG
ncbi:hypothetical protein [Cyanobium sp. PCC 7001]|uniref:hypothetical protein n=1 Tax=Cyanobium sp. PCC 7001 TaxID=180281 RepID=UPI0002E30A98|nr:hypothetical protein [Cyanobium sp. PCC 7001]